MELFDFYTIPLIFQIVLGFLVGYTIRIIAMEGYISLPEIQGNKIKLNTLGTLGIGLFSFLLFYSANPEVVSNFLTAGLLAYTSPSLFEKIPINLDYDPKGPEGGVSNEV